MPGRSNILWTSLFALVLTLAGCSNRLLPGKDPSSKIFEPLHKYSSAALQKDFDLMRSMLEKFHPSIYWYTSKDSMDRIFDAYRSAIRDSMTQQQYGFRIIAPVLTSLRCGHTSFSYSKKYSKAMRGLVMPSFPMGVKVWGDSMIVTHTLRKTDSLIRRGAVIHSIDGFTIPELTSILFAHMPTDGYAESINYIRLSNAFPYYHRNIFGLKKTYSVDFTDSAGRRTVQLPLFDPGADSAKITDSRKMPRKKTTRQERLKNIRSLKTDNERKLAVMELNSFDGGNSLNSFFRRSFRELEEKNIDNLVIDIRNNGGGKVNHYTKLATYLRRTPFKVADSSYAVQRKFGEYGRYFSQRTLNSLALGLFTSRRPDGLYHFKYWEKHLYKPKKNNFFSGRVYVLIGGPTFSASTLFSHCLKGQDNVTFIGEETGGGHHGNNGLLIPNITLPHTGLRVRMPLFRLIQYKHPPKNGRGVLPDVYVPPTSRAVLSLTDLKMQKAFELIRTNQRTPDPDTTQ